MSSSTSIKNPDKEFGRKSMNKLNTSSLPRTVAGAFLGSVLIALGAGSAMAAESVADESLPAPRDAEGHILISRAEGERSGLWVPDYRSSPPTFNFDEVEFKPWAKGLYDDRQRHDLEPHARCKASGAVRQLLTPYGVEILDLPDLQRIYIFDIGGPHTFREIYMDGRSHPTEFENNNYGHSIGWWEGDTLVIDSIGYNTEFWFERRGLPHTEAAHVIEYYTRTDHDSMEYRFVMEDAQTYNSAVEGRVSLNWRGDQELFEYLCQQANYAYDLMVNEKGEAIGRTSRIVP